MSDDPKNNAVADQRRGLSYGEAATMCLISAVLGIGASLAGALYLDRQQDVRIAGEATRFATIDTSRLLASFIAQQAASGVEGEALQQATLEWTRDYQEIVWSLHDRTSVVILDAKSVAAGAEDVTDVVAQALR